MATGRLEFTFHQCLGKGGFGEVYLATVTRPGGLAQQAAVKVLKEGLRKENEAVQRLRDEGRMLATLNHPCILRVHELTRVAGRIALVTEYVDGIDLSRCAKPDRLLPPKVVIQALGEVADALDCAWNTPSPETGNPLKLIHRDIKPENVRVSCHGQVKLLDFGIARTTEMHRHAHTQAGDLPFTPGYAAPEAFTRGFQGTASDVYALGVTMFRLLVGERLYEGMDLSKQVTTAAMPSRYGPFLDDRLKKVRNVPGVRELLVEMLGYEPDGRPTAIQVRESCERIAEKLDGPGLTRWARSVKFPPPKDVKGASLTGKTLPEDGGGMTSADAEEESSASFEPVAKAEPLAALTETLARPATPAAPSLPPPPPPLPTGIGSSVKPQTAPPMAGRLAGVGPSPSNPGAVGLSLSPSNPGAAGLPLPPAFVPPPPDLHTAKTVLRDEAAVVAADMAPLAALPEGLRSVAPAEMAHRKTLPGDADSTLEGGEEMRHETVLRTGFTDEVPRTRFFTPSTITILLLLVLVAALSVAFVAVVIVAVVT